MTKSVSNRSQNSSPPRRKSSNPKSNRPAQWWEQIDSPLAYAICAIFAVAVFYDFGSSQESIVYKSMMQLREVLIELGGDGFRTTLKRAVNLDAQATKWTLCILAVVLHAFVLWRLWKWINADHGGEKR